MTRLGRGVGVVGLSATRVGRPASSSLLFRGAGVLETSLSALTEVLEDGRGTASEEPPLEAPLFDKLLRSVTGVDPRLSILRVVVGMASVTAAGVALASVTAAGVALASVTAAGVALASVTAAGAALASVTAAGVALASVTAAGVALASVTASNEGPVESIVTAAMNGVAVFDVTSLSMVDMVDMVVSRLSVAERVVTLLSVASTPPISVLTSLFPNTFFQKF